MNVSGFSVRRDWLRDNRETAVRFLRALLRAYDVLRKDERVAISAGAREMGISDEWAEAIYAYTPPSNMYLWADPGIVIRWPRGRRSTGGWRTWGRSCSTRRSFRSGWICETPWTRRS